MSDDGSADGVYSTADSRQSRDQAFAANLTRLRKAQGISQELIAEKMQQLGHSFHQATIYKIETGLRRVQLAEAMDLATILGTNTDEMTRASERVTFSPEQMRFASNMRTLREKLHIDENELAEALVQNCVRIDPMAIRNIEEFRRNVAIDEAYSIARVLGVDMDVMMGGFLPASVDVMARARGFESAKNSMIATLVECYNEDWLYRAGELAYAIHQSIDESASFSDLSNSTKLGIAFCLKVLDGSEQLETVIRQIGMTFGDSQGETREDRWSIELLDQDLLAELRDWRKKYAGGELDQLMAYTGHWIYTQILIGVQRESDGLGKTVGGA